LSGKQAAEMLDCDLNEGDAGMAEAVLKTKLVNFLAPSGLWVGGKVTVTHSTIFMNANAMNRMVQDGVLDIEIPMASIRKVSLEWGFMTKIVCLETDYGYFYFRCFGAKEMVSMITKMYVSRALQRT
jgi:hypothetical protein